MKTLSVPSTSKCLPRDFVLCPSRFAYHGDSQQTRLCGGLLRDRPMLVRLRRRSLRFAPNANSADTSSGIPFPAPLARRSSSLTCTLTPVGPLYLIIRHWSHFAVGTLLSCRGFIAATNVVAKHIAAKTETQFPVRVMCNSSTVRIRLYLTASLTALLDALLMTCLLSDFLRCWVQVLGWAFHSHSGGTVIALHCAHAHNTTKIKLHLEKEQLPVLPSRMF